MASESKPSPSHVLLNPNPETKAPLPYSPSGAAATALVSEYHKHILPSYAPTPLRSLPSTAQALGLSHVLVKDESSRFGLPAFKVLGASWAVYRAVADKLGINILGSSRSSAGAAANLSHSDGERQSPSDRLISLADLGTAARRAGLRLVTSTEGNWGRAVARLVALLGISARVHVPGTMTAATAEAIRAEGRGSVEVVFASGGDYDACFNEARAEAARDEGVLLVLDVGWEGYTVIPEWVVEGYSTMLLETDQQLPEQTGGKRATHAIVPVGAGSIAQAVTQHYKRGDSDNAIATVIGVEAATAACLKASLAAGKSTSVQTTHTIMCGMDCGTLSTTAWPVLSRGVDACVTVTDPEAHEAVKELESLGVRAGPCGAATLAALKRACKELGGDLGLGRGSVVVLFCTEGTREYEVPHS